MEVLECGCLDVKGDLKMVINERIFVCWRVGGLG